MPAITIADLPCMCARIRQASRIVTAAYDDALRPSGLRITQYSILQMLSASGELSQNELGVAMALDRTTLSRSLKPLVAQGFVKLVAAQDKRLRVFALTADGKRALAAAREGWLSAQRDLKRKLGPEMWERLGSDLREVART